eukprot:2104744-Ditylum_brightwellii.AAC.1
MLNERSRMTPSAWLLCGMHAAVPVLLLVLLRRCVDHGGVSFLCSLVSTPLHNPQGIQQLNISAANLWQDDLK